MYEELVKIAQLFEIPQLIGFAIIIWFFTKDLRHSLKTLADDFHKMNTRVSRLEGTIFGKDIYEHVKED